MVENSNKEIEKKQRLDSATIGRQALRLKANYFKLGNRD